MFWNILHFFGCVMKAVGAKLSRLVRSKTEHACCSVSKDKWYWIVVGFVISITWLKPMKSHDQTIEARDHIYEIWCKKKHKSPSDFCLGHWFQMILGHPFASRIWTFNGVKRKKVLTVLRAIQTVSTDIEKVKPLEDMPFHLVRFAKAWRGASSFCDRKLG